VNNAKAKHIFISTQQQGGFNKSPFNRDKHKALHQDGKEDL
jgi:hypothetical protein